MKALESFLGGMGVIFIMLGIFTRLEFMLGLIIALFFWISSGAVSQLLEPEDRPPRHRRRSRRSSPKAEWSSTTPSSRFCSKCGGEIEQDSIFCSNCGEKYSG